MEPGEEHADEALTGDGSVSWLQTRSQPRAGARSSSLPCITAPASQLRLSLHRGTAVPAEPMDGSSKPTAGCCSQAGTAGWLQSKSAS